VRLAPLLLVSVVLGSSGACKSSRAEIVRVDPTADGGAALMGAAPPESKTKGAPDAATADSPGERRPRPPPARWALWPMPNAPSSGLPHPQSYDATASGGVLDNVTGLMWQRRVDPLSMTFDDANALCDRAELGGYRDWRLPSRIELVSILDLVEIQPSIDRDAFPRTPSDWFWTSSVASDSPAEAWYVYFYFGYPKTDERRSRFSVRCVRTARAPAFSGDPDSRYDVASATVHDLATGLTWQRALSPGTFRFQPARAYCSDLNLDGHKGWRVPSMPELVTLVDERASNPAIDLKAFPETPAVSFWTSSLFGSDRSTEAWHVTFDHGSALYGFFKETFRVRCVR
jgi:Protein of unknown function (DUF1566)